MSKQFFRELINVLPKKSIDHVSFMEKRYNREIDRQNELDKQFQECGKSRCRKHMKAVENKNTTLYSKKTRNSKRVTAVQDRFDQHNLRRDGERQNLSDKSEKGMLTAQDLKESQLLAKSDTTRLVNTSHDLGIQNTQKNKTKISSQTVNGLIEKLNCPTPDISKCMFPQLNDSKLHFIPQPPPKRNPNLTARPPRLKSSGRGFITEEAVDAAKEWLLYKKETAAATLS